jgi:hypothetical protein
MNNSMKRFIRIILNSIGLEIKSTHDFYFNSWRYLKRYNYYEPGHYYSPYASFLDIQNAKDRKLEHNDILGVDLCLQEQYSLLNELTSYYPSVLWSESKQERFRYFFNNDYFSFSDAIFLHCIIMHFKPKRVIEVGSGFSSAAILDINQHLLDNSLQVNFVEPYPEERLFNLISENERKNVHISFIQEMPVAFWQTLEENDILFIDTSHVSKFESDVNYIFFQVLPRLKKGVIIHFHDIFYPFDYPIEWLEQGRAWNESYMLRSFLMYNPQFRILLFPSLLEQQYSEYMLKNFPMCMKTHATIEIEGIKRYLSILGQSIYIQKV